MSETIQSIIEWSQQTFPDATLDGQRTKFYEEMNEWRDSPRDVSELADMLIVACSIGRFDSMSAVSAFVTVYQAMEDKQPTVTWCELEKAVNEKMTINRARTWEKRDGQYKHKE